MKPRIKSKLLTVAFTTPNALFPGYIVHLIPHRSAPCGSLQAGVSSCWSSGHSGPILAVLLPGMLFPQVVGSLHSSLHSGLYSNVSSLTLKHCPLFHHFLSLILLFSSEDLSLSDIYTLTHTHTHVSRLPF